jgi:hypothetical protein
MTDLRVKRGDTISLAVGPVRAADGSVQNITGHTLRFTAKAKLSDADGAALVAGSTADGRIVITNGLAGLALVSIPASVTDGFTADRVLHWDIQDTDPGGAKKTLDSGKLIVERDVTRA